MNQEAESSVDIKVTRQAEGLHATQAIALAFALFQGKYKGCLIPPDREISREDASRVEEFLLEAFPPDGENYRTHGHVQLTGEFAARIAEKLKLNPHEFRILGLLHDAGRFITHRYFRNDLVGDALMKKLGIPDSFLQKLQPNASYLKPEEFVTKDSLTKEQRVIIIADICGKRKDDGSIQTLEETLARHYATRVNMPRGPWPSQNRAVSVTTPEVVEQWGKLYEAIAKDFEETNGIDVEQIRQEILAEEASADL